MSSFKEREEKVLSCHGKMDYHSIARVLGLKIHVVRYIMKKHRKEPVYKNYSLRNLNNR